MALNDDILLEKQINEANILGNSLISSLIADGIAENKRNIILRSNLKSTAEITHNYSMEVEKLRFIILNECQQFTNIVLTLWIFNFRSLKAGIVHEILNKKDVDCALHIELAGKLISRIESTLKKHIKHNASQVVTREELMALNDEVNLLSSINERLLDINVPQDELREHLSSIEEMQSNLIQITSTLETTKKGVEALQQNVISEASILLN
jgi:hypothetical protein